MFGFVCVCVSYGRCVLDGIRVLIKCFAYESNFIYFSFVVDILLRWLCGCAIIIYENYLNIFLLGFSS